MPNPEDRLEALLKKFEAEYDARNPRLAENLRDLLERSPALAADIRQAVADGNLSEIKLLESNPNNSGAEYSRKHQRISIPEDHLANSHTPNRYDEEMIFKLGHELRHAVDRTNGTQDNDRFNEAIWRISETPDRSCHL